VLLHCLTVRETFLVAAKLRLPGSVPTAEKEQVVEQVIQELGLVKAGNTKIGNSCALTSSPHVDPVMVPYAAERCAASHAHGRCAFAPEPILYRQA